MVYILSFAHTPQTWSELLGLISLHPKDDEKPIFYAAILGYNNIINELNSKNAAVPFPIYRITSSDFPNLENMDEFCLWIEEFPKNDQTYMTTAYAMGSNFAVHCFENGTLMGVAMELASVTHEERVEAMRFPLTYDSSSIDITSSDGGSIYILARDSGNIVKVGETSRNPRVRGSEYIAEYKLVGFNFYKSFNIPSELRKDIESIAHQKLSNKRLSWDDTSGARKVFECSVEEAEQAVLEAIEESEAAAKVAVKEEFEKQMSERAEFRFNNELEAFRKEWMKKWDVSDASKQLNEALSDFVESNTFDKLGVRGVLHYFWLTIGWFFKIIALLNLIGMLRYIFFDPFEFTFLLTSVGIAILTYGVGWVFIGLSVTFVPDEDKIAMRRDLEQEFERRRDYEKNKADNTFRKEHTTNEFY